MDETANEIEAQIDRTRERLGSNLRELEDKVDAATDWREHFRERPHLFLGAAFVGGVAACERGRARSRRGAATGQMVVVRPRRSGNGSVQAQALELWNNVQGRWSAWRARGSRSTSANWFLASTSTIAALSSAARSIRRHRRPSIGRTAGTTRRTTGRTAWPTSFQCSQRSGELHG